MIKHVMPEKVVRADDWNEYNALLLNEVLDKLNQIVEILSPKAIVEEKTEQKPARKTTKKTVK